MQRSTIRLFLLTFVCLIGSTATAQISTVPGSGCSPNTQYPTWSGTAQVGTQIRVTSPCQQGLVNIAVLALRSSPVTMPNGFSCQPGCVLYPTVDLTWVGLRQWGDTVNAAWVGLCMYFQFVCWDRTQNCVDSSYGALQICFTT